MHALLVKVTVNDEQSALPALREQVVPAISQVPGFVTGYWTRKGDSGVSLVVFESEDAATRASERVGQAAPEGVTIDDIEIREVVASA